MTALRPLKAAAPLRIGSRVAVVAPSGPIDPQHLAAGCAALGSLGFQVSLGTHVLDRTGFLAGTDRDRAADLQAAWCDPAVDAVFCARGGYGGVRLFDHLDWAAMRAAIEDRPAKAFIGASDITSLHQAFAHHLGVSTYYGANVAGRILGQPEPSVETLDGLRAALLSPSGPKALTGGRSLVAGTAGGITTGGTLAMLCSLLGSPEARHARGGIVLLEDVGEAPYRIDRMLTQLLRSGWLDGATGIACGSWERCGNLDQIAEVILERLSGLGVPILIDLTFGHGPIQATVPLGVPAVLDADSATLTFAADPGSPLA